MEFAVFLPRKQEPVYHSTKLDVYRQSQEVLRSLDFVDPPGFATGGFPSGPQAASGLSKHLTPVTIGDCRFAPAVSFSMCRGQIFATMTKPNPLSRGRKSVIYLS